MDIFITPENGASKVCVENHGVLVTWVIAGLHSHCRGCKGAQMAELFQTTPQNITLHLKAIFAEGELDEQATCKDYLQVRQEGTRAVSRGLRHYSLPAILAIGYRVRSHRGSQFRHVVASARHTLKSIGVASTRIARIIAPNNTRHASPRCAPGGLLFCGVEKA